MGPIAHAVEVADFVRREAPGGVDEQLDILATTFYQAARLIDPTITGGGKSVDMTRPARRKGRIAPLAGVHFSRA